MALVCAKVQIHIVQEGGVLIFARTTSILVLPGVINLLS